MSSSITSRPWRVFVLFALLALLMPALALALTQEQELIALTPNSGAHAGSSVSISADTAVVGAPDDNGGAGAAYVFTRSGTTWTNVATLVASDAAATDHFGSAVSVSTSATTNVIAVGAPSRNAGSGAVYVFVGSGATWTQNTILTSSRGAPGDLVGTSVSADGFNIAVGAPNATAFGRAQAGGAFVFSSTNSGTSWQQFNLALNRGQAGAGDHFGTAISLSAGTVLIGSPNDKIGNKTNTGTVQVFIRSGGQWLRQARLNSGTAGTLFGSSVSLFSNTAVIGAPGSGNGQGAVYVYTRSGTSWSAAGTLTATGGVAGDHFGASVAASGSAFVAGAPNANGGMAYLFANPGTGYAQVDTLVPGDNSAGDNFGASVSLDSGRAVVGSPFNSNSSATADGAAFVFVTNVATKITFTSVTPEPSALGQQYTVNVQVTTDPASASVPTGTVDISDPFGANCLAVPLDLNGSASCQLVANNTGTLTITANYSGDVAFAATTNTYGHQVIGFSFVFVQQPGDLTVLDDVPQGNRLSGVTVQELDDSNALVATDNTTQVQLSLPDPCNAGGTITFGPVTVSGGIADFTDAGPRFYTQTTGGFLQLTAAALNATVSPATSSVFDVVAPPPEFLYADGFESCRL